MRAHVLACNHTLRTVTARTENDLSVVFQVVDDSELQPGDALDIPLPQVLVLGLVHLANGGSGIRVRLRRDDVHDLRVTGGGHGVPSDVSDERMSAL
jgi:hypothetical protein